MSGVRWSSCNMAATGCRARRSIGTCRTTTISARPSPIAGSSSLRRTTCIAARIGAVAQSQGQHDSRHAVLVHPRPARAHSRLARIAALRRRRSHCVLRSELRRRDGRAYSRDSRKCALSICSGDFNQWTRKVAATDQPFSFMRTIEWEMPCWNWGHTFDYAEMTYLIFPRPFMVERGHLDLVGRDQWVAHEYGRSVPLRAARTGRPHRDRNASRAATASVAGVRSRSCTSTCGGRCRGEPPHRC